MSVFSTRIFIENTEIQLTDNFDGAITYSISDITDIGSIKGPFSKTITIPGTSANIAAMGYFQNIKSSNDFTIQGLPNIGSNYNFKRKARAYVLQGQQVVLQGYARLVSATVTNGQVSFSITIFSELNGIIADLGDALIEDLVPTGSVTAFDHKATLGVIQSTWNISSSDAASASGAPYLWPVSVDYGQYDTANFLNVYVGNCRPAIYAKQYIDLIFASASYTYSSNFFTSSYFESLVIPYAEGNTTTGTIFDCVVGVSGSQGGNILTQSFAQNFGSGSLIFNSTISDPNNVYSASLERYYATSSGVYSVDFELDYVMDLHVTDGTAANVKNNDLALQYNLTRYTANGTYVSNQAATFRDYPLRSLSFQVSASYNESDKVSGITSFLNAGDYLTLGIIFSSSFADSQRFILGGFVPEPVAGTAKAYINATSTNLNVELNSSYDGANLKYADYCLKSIRCIDFLSSIISLFGLFMVADKWRPKHFHFYTRNEYYQQGEQIIDWSDKVDYSQDITTTTIPFLTSKNLLLQYQQGSDFWSTYWSQLYGSQGYGTLQVSTDYDFNSNTVSLLGDSFIFAPLVPVVFPNGPNRAFETDSEATIEISMTDKSIISVSGYSSSLQQDSSSLPSLTPLNMARRGVPISYYGRNYLIGDVYNPYSFQLNDSSGNVVTASRGPGQANTQYYATTDQFTYLTYNKKLAVPVYQSSDNDITRSPVKNPPSIMCYNGLVSCDPWILQYTPVIEGLNYSYYQGSPFAGGYYVQLNKYPQLHHISAVDNSDLLFSIPQQTFFPVSNYTTASNFQNYHFNQVLSITDNDADMYTAQLNLSATDISELDFRNIYQINGTNFIVNSINDYSPNPDTTTEVELLRLPYQLYPSPVPTVISDPVILSITAEPFLTGSITDVRVGGLEVQYGTGSLFPISASQSGSYGTFSSGTSNQIVDVDLSNAIVGEILVMTGTDGVQHNNVISTPGAQTIEFTNIPMFPGGSAALDVMPYAPATTTTTTTLPPGTLTFTICNSPQGPVSVTGFISVTGLVNTNVTVNFTVVDSTLASHTGSATVLSGNSSATWGSVIATSSSISSITINSLSPTSNAGQTFVNGGWSGACGATTSTTTTISLTTTTTGAPTTTTTTTIAPTTTTTTAPPSVNISNTRPGATISSVTGISGFTSGVISSGGSVSGNHSSFTGAINVNFSAGPTSNCNLYLTGVHTQTIAVSSGFTGTKSFTSATYAATDTIDITLAP